MRIDKSVIFRICITVIMCIAMLPYQVLYADKMPDNREPVDVGVVLQPGIAMPTDKGVYFGFDTEYMYKIAQYANLKVIYHPYSNFPHRKYQRLLENRISQEIKSSSRLQ